MRISRNTARFQLTSRTGDYAYITDLNNTLNLVAPPGDLALHLFDVDDDDEKLRYSGRYLCAKRDTTLLRLLSSWSNGALHLTAVRGGECRFCGHLGNNPQGQARYHRSVPNLFDIGTPAQKRARWITLGSSDGQRLGIVTDAYMASALCSLDFRNEPLVQSGHAYRAGNPIAAKLDGDGQVETASIADTHHAESNRSDECDDIPSSKQASFAVSRRQLRIIERIFGDYKEEAAGQARWNDIVRVRFGHLPVCPPNMLQLFRRLGFGYVMIALTLQG